jgi:Phage integrase, N-terminal SAM-like domain
MRDDALPEIIRAAGKQAVRAYWEYLDDPKWKARTREMYGQHIRRFFRWAARRELTLQSITYASCAEFTASLSAPSAKSILSAVRCLFKHLVTANVLAENPLAPRRPGPRPTVESGDLEPSISLSELKEAVRELGDWEEDSEFFQAGLVVLAPLSINTMETAAIASFTGVPEPVVREFAARLLESGVWRPDGKIDVWGEEDTGATSLGDLEITEVFFDVYIAVGNQRVCRLVAAGNDAS